MNKTLDLTIDWLADAPLTPEQRHAWNLMRTELVSTREVASDMAKQIKTLENATIEEQHSILTRPEFNREVARMLAFDERYGGTSSVLYFDFNNLDEIAAQQGRSVANEVTREISTVLMRCVRGSDILGRLAPDEFGVLLVRCDNAAAWKKGEQLASDLFKSLAELHGCKPAVSINYGAYTFSENEDVSAGLKQAAQAVTKAK